MRLLSIAFVAAALAGCGGGGCDSKAGTPLLGSQCSAASDAVNPVAPIPGPALFSLSGVGPSVIALPDIDTVTITATSPGNENLFVYYGGDLIVNEIVGATSRLPRYTGTFLVKPRTTLIIQGGGGVEWTVTGQRLPPKL